MKKLLTVLSFLMTTQVFAELPIGDVTLVAATKIGVQGIELRQAKIEKKERKTFIIFPNIGEAELIQSQDKKEFYAVFTRKTVMHEGKEYDSLLVTVFSGVITDDGDIFCSLNSVRPNSGPHHQSYLLKSGVLE